MDLIPLTQVLSDVGAAALWPALVGGFLWAVLTGRLEPRATSKRVEEVMEKRYQTLVTAYEISETGRKEAVAFAQEALRVQRDVVGILRDIRAAGGPEPDS